MLTTLALISAPILAQTLPALIWLAVIFFVIAIIAYVLGAQGVAGMSAEVGRILLFVFLILAVILLLASFFTGRGPAV